MLEAGPIFLVDMFAPVDRFSAIHSLLYPNSLQQTFTSIRPISPESYTQDLAEFMIIWGERRAWIKSQKFPGVQEYMAIPGSDSSPSQFCIITAFGQANDAGSYRKHFYP